MGHCGHCGGDKMGNMKLMCNITHLPVEMKAQKHDVMERTLKQI